MKLERMVFDVLVLGTGAAGLRAAIQAREKGLNVCAISKALPGMATSTILSGGAFAGGHGGLGPEDHRRRTLQAGRGINQRELLDVLVQDAPSRLQELVDWGMRSVSLEGYVYAEGRPPVWGEEIVRCLVAKARASGVEFMGGVVGSRQLTHEGLSTMLAFSVVREKWLAISSRALILATGGAGALYLRHDNPQRMMGDGYVLALEAGATLQDMEFVQFYPLGLAEPRLPSVLIPPRLADKGRIVNGKEENILAKYDIQERPAAERARDRLSLALFLEIYHHGEAVWLDLTNVSDEEWCSDPLSASTRAFLGERYRMKDQPVRIAPLAHHVMGGVRIDPNGVTSVPGLFAAGEVTGGLHGANRMGGNALTETLVFGSRAGEAAASWAESRAGTDVKKRMEDLREYLPRTQKDVSGAKAPHLKEQLREILWKDGGIFRTRQGLTRALDGLRKILDQTPPFFSTEDPRSVQQAVELHLAARAATIILQAAFRREESRGAHYRHDHPKQDDDRWLGHLQIQLSPEGEEHWTFQAIDNPNPDYS
jgi:succinate dehydrogenase/fumarate reductase flavoprotein subunit